MSFPTHPPNSRRHYEPADDLFLITTYFNPAGYRSRRENYERFRAPIDAANLSLLTVECVFGDTAFQLPAGADVLQVRARDTLWQKERLLNIALSTLPRRCEKVAWLDADLLFESPTWAIDAARLLEEFPLIQLFDQCRALGPTSLAPSPRGKAASSFAASYLRNGKRVRRKYADHGHTGYAWAARREVLEGIGLYDACILGGGDHVLAHVACADFESPCVRAMIPNAQREHFQHWADRFADRVGGNLGGVRGRVNHLWHGARADRQHPLRHKVLDEFDFEPRTDLRLAPNGAWEWASEKPGLHRWAKNYFRQRREDGEIESVAVPRWPRPQRRLLFACYEVPGWGGASTSRYRLFERLQADGHDVHWINLIDEADAFYFRQVFGEHAGNPAHLPNVESVTCRDRLFQRHEVLQRRVRSIDPDVVVGVGFIAAHLLRLAAPSRKLVFMTSGCRQVKSLLERGIVHDFQAWRRGVARGVRFPSEKGNREKRAVEEADLIIVHSPLVREAFEHLYPSRAAAIYDRIISVADFIYPEVERFARLRLPFNERDIDVAFVCTTWDEPRKNYDQVCRIVDRRPDLRTHVVGELPDTRCSAVHHGVIRDRESMYALLGRTRVLVHPSLWDPAPGVLFEASAMGCNVVASPNSGNVALCHPDLVARTGRTGEFVTCMERGIERPYPDNRERFRGDYDDLVETLMVV